MALSVTWHRRGRAAFDSLMARPFLQARWCNVVMMNWAVEPAMLASHVPPGMEIDTSLDGRAYASLVAFEFRETRLMGVRVPGLWSFPEVNLRFYVREKGEGEDRRGVCFVREFVPARSAVLAARGLY